jgi:hypothetical protein
MKRPTVYIFRRGHLRRRRLSQADIICIARYISSHFAISRGGSAISVAACDLALQGWKRCLVRSGGPFEKILRSEKLELDEHLSLDDSDVLFHIKRWIDSDDKILSDLSGRFLDRRLFKAFDLDMPRRA